MTTKLEVHGLDELREKFQKFPNVFAAGMKTTLTAVLLFLWGKIPPYPPPPPSSTYKRTGTLGRSLGSSMGGLKMGQPDIMRIKRGLHNVHEARFGTNLGYAPEVIGDRQKPVHTGRWWTLTGVAKSAEEGIIKLFEAFAAKLAAWLSDEGPEPREQTSFTVRG